MRHEFLTLMERRLLPRDALDFDLDDPAARAEIEMVLSEMREIKAKIDAIMPPRGEGMKAECKTAHIQKRALACWALKSRRWIPTKNWRGVKS